MDVRSKEEILQITGFIVGIFPFRYLGIPLATEKLRVADYSVLVDSISERIKAWPRNTLSYAGKLELTRAVIQGI